MNGWRHLLPNAWYIALREYKSRVRSKTFVLGTLLLAGIGFVAAQGPLIVNALTSGTTHVAVYTEVSDLPSDAMTVLTTALNGQAPAGSSTDHPAFALARTPSLSEAERQLRAGEVSGVLVINRDPATHELTFKLEANTTADSREAAMARNAATSLAIEDRLQRAGVSMADVLAPAKLTVEGAGGKGPSLGEQTDNTSDQASKYLLTTGLIVLIMMAIITYGVWVATSVAEEKGSRVMELMLNAATPLQMLAGKVIGNGAAGLTQYGAVVVVAFVGLAAQRPIAERLGVSGGTSFSGLSPWLFAAFLVLFLLGFLLYALLYAALGSLVSRQEDVQSATAPLMFLVMAGYFVSVFSLAGMDEPWAVGLSYVPFFSPYLMLSRIALGHVAIWEFAVVVVLMLASSAIALLFAARIYSAGVLLYGQRVSLRKVFSAARVSR